MSGGGCESFFVSGEIPILFNVKLFRLIQLISMSLVEDVPGINPVKEMGQISICYLITTTGKGETVAWIAFRAFGHQHEARVFISPSIPM